MTFKAGDKVRCLNALDAPTLRVGEIYEVKDCGFSAYVLLVKPDQMFSKSRFEKVDDDMPKYVELNGTKYVAKDIPGHGQCLVPYVEPRPTWGSLVGKVVMLRENAGQRSWGPRLVVKDTYSALGVRTIAPDGLSTGSYSVDNEISKEFDVTGYTLADWMKGVR